MGGKGSGGARVGAGRKKKSDVAHVLHGTATLAQRKRVKGAAPLEEFDAPDDLTRDERLVWMELAPHAFAARTLTPATSYAFRLFCRNVMLERAIAMGKEAGGSNHRGIMQLIRADLARFCLSGTGKPVIEEEPAADEWAEFDQTDERIN